MATITQATIESSKRPLVTENQDGTFSVTIYDPSESDLLLGLEPYEAVKYFGAAKLLDEIGEDEAVKYWGLLDKSLQYQMEEDLEQLRKEIDFLKGEANAELIDDKNYIDFTEEKQ